MNATRPCKSVYTAPRQPIVVYEELSPSRRFVLQTSHVWAPKQKAIASPSRGLRTPDMQQPTASILHSENAHLFSNIAAPMQLNNRSVLTLSEHADLTLNHIESGFAPQKMCAYLKKIGVLVPVYTSRTRVAESMTLHYRMCKTELLRTLPKSHFRPFAAECVHFYPYSVRTLEKQHTNVQTDSLCRSLITASISNYRFADHMPTSIPGADLIKMDKNIASRRTTVINPRQITGNLEKEIVSRKIEDNCVFSRLDAFESRQNTASKLSAEIITLLCVNCDALRYQDVEQLDEIVLKSFDEDMTVSMHQQQMKLKLNAGERVLDYSGLYFDESVYDVNVRTVIALIKSEVVTRLKMLLLSCNCVTQTKQFTWVVRSAALLQLAGPYVRDAFYQFLASLVQQNLSVFFANKRAYYSPALCISVAVFCRLNYYICSHVLGLAVARLDAMLRSMNGEDDQITGYQSTMRSLLQNSLARNTQFTLEHDRLTISVQRYQQDESIANQCEKLLCKEWSDADEICYTVVIICNAAFGILQLILYQQERLRSTKTTHLDYNDAQQQIKQFQEVLARVFSQLDEAVEKCVGESIYRQTYVDELMLRLLGTLPKDQLFLGDRLVTLGFECTPAWLKEVKQALAELFSE